MTDAPLAAIDVARLVKDHFGPRASHLTLRKDGSIEFAVYDAFPIVGHPDDYGSGTNWGFGVVLAPTITISEVLGTRLTIRSGPAQITSALQAIDRYARLRLGQEYLTAYEGALGVM